MRLNGKDIIGKPPYRVFKSGFARTFQDSQVFFYMTGLENVMVLAPWGIGITIVEQNVDMGLKVADRVNMLENGQVVFSGTPADLGGEEARQPFLGLL